MNRIRIPIRRAAGIVTGLAGALLASSAAASAAFAYMVPPRGVIAGPPPYLPAPPAQTPHQMHSPVHAPPLIHTVIAGGMPGWQISLIAVATAILAAAAAVILDRARATRRHQAAPST